jgi:nucleoside-diphosphate-sugar epimerase
MSMRTVFVTGATGFIGSHLVRELLRRGDQVKCLVRPTANVERLQHAQIELVIGTLDDSATYRESLAGCDTVLHVAGLISAIRKGELRDVNTDGTRDLARICSEARQPPRFVYVSSIAAAGPPLVGKEVRDESDALTPISDYGRSKRLAEAELQKLAAELPVTVIRPGIVYGPGDDKTVIMFRSIHRLRLHLVIGFRTPPLALIHVEDLVRLILDAAERGETLEAHAEGEYSSQGYYNACDDAEFPTYWQFGKRIGKSMQCRVFVWPVWRWVGRTVGFVGETANRMRGRSCLLNVDKVREATVRSWANSAEKARQQLGFEASKSLDDRLAETAESFKRDEWL